MNVRGLSALSENRVMAGRRHHTIPQFLLRGFVSSARGRDVRTWLYRKESVPVEVNIINVAAEKDFYGTRNEPDLDDRITTLEPGFASLVNGLRSTSVSAEPLRDARISELVTHLSLRTRALRQSAISLTTGLTDGLREHLAQPELLRAELRKKLGKREMLGIFRKHLTDEGRPPVEIERLLIRNASQAIAAIERFLDEYVEEGATALDDTMRESIKGLPDSMRSHCIEALANNLDGGARAQAYARLNWFLVAVGEPLILGDSVCLFDTNGQRPFQPIDEEASKTKSILVPISADRLLVGTTAEKRPSIDARDVCDACARCSLEFFVSSGPVKAAALHKLIGSWAGVLSADETRSLLKDVRGEFPGSTS